jgi:hypothetical protein
MQVAHAQDGGAHPAPSGLASLISDLGALSMLALLVGLLRPSTFRFLFREKTTRKRVGWTFGVAMFACIVASGNMAPKRVEQTVAQSAPSAVAPGKGESAVRAAESRAKVAEARAVRAEKAAASANPNAKSGSAESEAKAAPKDESLSSNVEEVDIPGMGKRQVGTGR